MSDYDPAVVAAIRKIGQQRYGNDPKKLRRYLLGQFATGIVESGLQNLSGGDADSYGYRQQRESIYGRQPLDKQINNLYDEFEQYDKGQTVGELAAAVQRPAAQYRGRYAQVIDQARKLAGGGGVSGAGQASMGAQMAPTSMQTGAPAGAGVGNVFDYFAASTPTADPLQAQLQRGWQLLSQLQNQRTGGSVGPSTPSVGNVSSDVQGGKMPKGVAKFEDTKVAGWIAPILAYAREHGWKGQVNSGFRSLADQTRIYNSGVRPAAKPGTSNHEGSDFPRGAVDVSDAEQLAAILAKSPYRKKLVWAGAKDPVHFSFPHNGSY